ncbi:MAG: hypothetical protein U0804_02395 [Gemmataceae bacterium]
MTRTCATACAVLALLTGCGRPAVQRSPKPANDRAELEARYDRLQPGQNGPQIEAYLGARGAALTGYSTVVVRQNPVGANGAAATGELDRFWLSTDATCAVRVVFGTDSRARVVQFLTITPSGPPSAPPAPPEVAVAPAP